MSKMLLESSSGRANNTAFVRFLLTSTVIYSHSYVILLGTNETELIRRLTGGQASAGSFAVECFLILSGFLVTRSWFFSQGAADFLFRRVLRLYPGFLVAAVICGLIAVPRFIHIGPDPQARPLAFWADIMAPALLLKFKALWANGSMWILPYEIGCYLVVVFFALAGVFSRRRVVLALWVLNCCVYVCQYRYKMFPSHDLEISRLLNSFLGGMALYLYRDRIPLRWSWFCVAALGLVVFGSILRSWVALPIFTPFFGGYVLLFACYHRVGRLQHFARHGDFSYGAFLYAYPVQLALTMNFREHLHPLTLFLVSLPLATLCGAASWFLIERPFLQLKRLTSKPRPEASASAPTPLSTSLPSPHISIRQAAAVPRTAQD